MRSTAMLLVQLKIVHLCYTTVVTILRTPSFLKNMVVLLVTVDYYFR